MPKVVWMLSAENNSPKKCGFVGKSGMTSKQVAVLLLFWDLFFGRCSFWILGFAHPFHGSKLDPARDFSKSSNGLFLIPSSSVGLS